MLVLSRQTGEKIKIGDSITVIVSRIAGNRVMLAVEAPRDIHIVRGELKPLTLEEREARMPKGPAPLRVPAAPAPGVQTEVEITPNGVSYLARRAR